MLNTKLIAVGGCSAAGKSTLTLRLAAILLDVGATVFILRQDAFFKNTNDIPIDADTGGKNWELPTALDLGAFRQMLKEIRSCVSANQLSQLWTAHHLDRDGQEAIRSANKSTQQWLLQGSANIRIVEDTNVHRDRFNVSVDETLNQLARAIESTKDCTQVVILVDGFMLFHDLSGIAALFDKHIFTWAEYQTCKQRRQARTGYACADGFFWQDPPDYFDKYVWPIYEQLNQPILGPLGNQCDTQLAIPAHGGKWVSANIIRDTQPDILRVFVINSNGPPQQNEKAIEWLEQQYARDLVWTTVTAVLLPMFSNTI